MKKILIAICAFAVVAALVAVVLLLTLPRCSKDKDAEERILEPSKEKIVSLEGSCLDQVWNTAKEGVSSFKDSKFDADVTVDLKVDSYYAGSSASTIANYLPYVTLNLAKDQMNVAAKLTVMGNTYLDLRLFDLDKDNMYLYCMPGSDKLYLIRLDSILDLIPAQGGSSTEMAKQVLQMLRSANVPQLLSKDYEAVKSALLGLFNSCEQGKELTIQTDASISLFGSDVPCEIYTICPTAEQFEAALNQLQSYALNGDGLIPTIVRLTGQAQSSIDNLKNQIPEAAEYLANHRARLEIAVSGNTILRQRAFLDDYCVGYDLLSDSNGKHFQLYYLPDATNPNRTIVFLDMTETNAGTVSFNISLDYFVPVSIKGNFDKNQKSVIGTYAGTVYVTYDGALAATITITPNGSNMIHTIELHESLFERSGIEKLAVKIETKPGSGVSRPNGAQIEDTTNYTVQDWQNLLLTLIGPFQGLLGGM